MIKKEKLSIQKQLMIWLSVFLLSSSTILVIINIRSSAATLKKQMHLKASLVCQKLAVVLSNSIWNIDDKEISDYFKEYPWELSDIATVRVLTEFNTPIYDMTYKSSADTLKCRYPVHHNGTLVGFIEVTMSQELLTSTQRSIMRSWSISMLLATFITLLIIYMVTKTLITRPVKVLTEGLRQIEAGNYEYRFPLVKNSYEALLIYNTVDKMSIEIGNRKKELEHENNIRKAAEVKLKLFTTDLETQVQERTRSLQKAYKDLQEEVKERQLLQNEVLSISDKERQRIGSDLHDSLGQQLTAVSLRLAILTKRLLKRNMPEVTAARELQEEMKGVTKEARSISHGLSPLRLHDDGLIATLHSLAVDTGDIHGIACKFTCDDNVYVTNQAIAIHLYRITQEAITNAQKHGKANIITITMNKHPNYNTMGEIHIEDNGCGITESHRSSDGIGLRSMNFRAEAIGGAINIEENNKIGGTTIHVTYDNSIKKDNLN